MLLRDDCNLGGLLFFYQDKCAAAIVSCFHSLDCSIFFLGKHGNCYTANYGIEATIATTLIKVDMNIYILLLSLGTLRLTKLKEKCQ